jgi:filamentous hemagglutinin family protein
MFSKRMYLTVFVFLLTSTTGINANPIGEQVMHGDVSFVRNGNDLIITQGSDRAIINWQDFSNNVGEITEFIQPSSLSATLNRVVSGNPSSLHGTLQANGQVYLINPNGILVGATGVINTQSFIASTKDVNNDDFIAGNDLTFIGDSDAAIDILGKVTANGGDIFLIARNINNQGELIANNGTIGLAASDEVILKANSDERLAVRVKDTQGFINNSGLIQATQVELKAAGNNEYALAINHDGFIRANGVQNNNGRVILSSTNGATQVSGEIESIAGTVKVLGDHVVLKNDTVVDTSSKTRGGEILIGGNVRGEGPEPNANTTIVEEDVSLNADANDNGDGGTIVVWADESVEMNGNASAKGGNESGDGGYIEVSAKEEWRYNGWAQKVNVSAPNGNNGTFLLDPNDINIIDAAASGTVAGSPTNANTLNDADIADFLQNTGSLVIETNGTGGSGDIDIDNGVDITWTAANDFTLNADRSITMNSGSRIQSTEGDITFNANLSGAASGTIDGIHLNNATITSEFGDILLRGEGGDDGGSFFESYGVILTNGARVISTGTGVNAATITIHGRGGSTPSGNDGVHLTDNNTSITSIDGAILITGIGNGTRAHNYGIDLRDGASIRSTGTGVNAATITLDGTGGNGSDGADYGVNIVGANTEITSVDGDINIDGTAGNGSAHSGNVGINIRLDALIRSTGTGTNAATINLNGIAGSGIDHNYGVHLDRSSDIRSVDGDITISGTGGAGISLNHGVYLGTDSTITSDGTGTIDVNGVSGAGTNQNHGVFIEDNANISSEISAINVTGTSQATGALNFGVVLDNASIAGVDTSTIDVTGTGGNGTDHNHGVYLLDDSTVTSNNGAINVTGQGNGNSDTNVGVFLQDSSEINSNADINISGTGGAGTDNNHGVLLFNNSNIVSENGATVITGQGDGAGVSNTGVSIVQSSGINSTGTGTIEINGDGSNGVDFNHGVVIRDDSVVTSTVDGDISIVGTASNGTNSHGVHLDVDGTPISSTVGTVSLTGTAASGHEINLNENTTITAHDFILNSDVVATDNNFTVNTGRNIQLNNSSSITSTDGAITLIANQAGASTGNFIGIELDNATITSENGDILLQGQGGDTGTQNYGVLLENNSIVSSTGTTSDAATITINGTGGSGTNVNTGVTLSNLSAIRSEDGTVNIEGQGNGTGEFNNGVYMVSDVIVASDGNATINIEGTSGAGTNQNHGVFMIDNVNITSNTSAINVNGTSQGNGVLNFGVNLSLGSSIEGNGAATVDVTGSGGNGTDFNHGVYLVQGSEISSDNGAINLMGQGNGNGNANLGVLLQNFSEITSNESIIVTGIGGDGAGNQGMHFISDSSIESTNGSIELTGISNNNSQDIQFNALSSVSNNNEDIVFNVDTLVLDNSTTIAGNGNLIITPRNVNTTIGLGDGSTGTLNLDATEISRIQDGFTQITIGRNDGTGTINITDAAFRDNVLIHAGDVSLTGVLSSTALNDAIVLEGTGNGRTATFNNAGGDIQTPNGRWLVYTNDKTTTVLGGLTPDVEFFNFAFPDNPAGLTATDNAVIYTQALTTDDNSNGIDTNTFSAGINKDNGTSGTADSYLFSNKLVEGIASGGGAGSVLLGDGSVSPWTWLSWHSSYDDETLFQ